MSRTFTMGDIHGNCRGLIQCLEKSGFNNDEDTLIQLGDVADGWSEVSESVDVLLSIKNLISIRGNHDVWCYDWFKYGEKPILWTEQGGKSTIESYIKSGKIMDNHHKDFWNDQQDWHIDDKNRLFIHAGWGYNLPGDFEKQCSYRVNAGTIAKECHWDRSLYESAKTAHHTKNKFKALESFNEVYIGHTAQMNNKPNQFLNLWNLDSGSGWNGNLTIMDIDTKEFWQSDLSKDLYPDQKGRG